MEMAPDEYNWLRSVRGDVPQPASSPSIRSLRRIAASRVAHAATSACSVRRLSQGRLASIPPQGVLNGFKVPADHFLVRLRGHRLLYGCLLIGSEHKDVEPPAGLLLGDLGVTGDVRVSLQLGWAGLGRCQNIPCVARRDDLHLEVSGERREVSRAGANNDFEPLGAVSVRE